MKKQNYYLKSLMGMFSAFFAVCLLFPLFKLTYNGEGDLTFTGLNLMLGMKVEETVGAFTTLKMNISLIIACVVSAANAILSFTDFGEKKYGILKNIISAFACFFSLIVFITIPNTFHVVHQLGGTYDLSMTAIGYVEFIFVALSAAFGLLNIFGCPVSEEDRSQNVLPVVTGVASLAIIASLFFAIGQISNSTGTLKLDGLLLSIGGNFEKEMFSMTSTKYSIFGIISYFAIIVAAIGSVITIRNKRAGTIIGSAGSLFASMFFLTLPTTALKITDLTSMYHSFTTGGYVVTALCYLLLIVNLYQLLDQKDSKVATGDLLSVIGILLLSTMFVNSYQVALSSGGNLYSEAEYTMFDIMFNNAKYNTYGTNPIYLYIMFALVVLAIIVSFMPQVRRKYRYIGCSLLYIGAAVMAAFAKINTFEAVTASPSYVCAFLSGGLASLGIIIILACAYLYLGSITSHKQ